MGASLGHENSLAILLKNFGIGVLTIQSLDLWESAMHRGSASLLAISSG
jgi:hypothetical protein